MYSIAVRDQSMIAHSVRGAVFGPAQRLHGATCAVELELRRPALDADYVVVDVGRLGAVLHTVLARVIFDDVAARPYAGELRKGARGCSAMHVVLHASPRAWAAYKALLNGGGV